jgi:hypothetical protein
MRQKKAWEITDDFWEEVKDLLIRESGKEARRWVVERIFSWLNRFRKLLVRYEK